MKMLEPLAALGVEAEYLMEVAEHGEPTLVWIVGAYKGKAAVAIGRAWPEAEIYAFEPQIWAAQELFRETLAMPNISCFPFGLADADHQGPLPMGEWGNDACSMLREPGQRDWGMGEGWFFDVEEFLASRLGGEGAPVDLTLMNCEGGEFLILPRLRETGLIRMFSWLLIQWHDAYVGEQRLREEMAQLSRTHELVRDGGKAWTLWRLREVDRASSCLSEPNP